jgi:hypothetical protein
MTVVPFPSIPMRPREVDPDFATELEAARGVGLATALVDHTRVVEGDPRGGVARVASGQGTALYRGWMLTPAEAARRRRICRCAHGARAGNTAERGGYPGAPQRELLRLVDVTARANWARGAS